MLRFKKKSSSKSSPKEKETLSDKRRSLLKKLFSKPDSKRPALSRRAQKSAPADERVIFDNSRIKADIISSKYSSGERPFFDASSTPFEFPSRYGDNKIVVMVRDPWWLYSYWEVRNDVEEKTRQQIAKDGAKPVKSVLRTYDITDKIFNGNNANRCFDIELRDNAASWYIHVGEPNRSWCVDIGIVADNGKFYTLARSNFVKTPRFGPSDVLDEEWLIPDEDFWKLFGLSGGYGIGKSSMELRGLIEKHLKEQAWSGGMFSGMSSFQPGEKKKNFWLMVDCELIVYGATEPDASVTVQGKPIKLRKDGTFTLRYTLPDGIQNIPVVATNKDGDDTRSITPIVSRRTERNP